jgi:hypothetical protein
MRFLRTNTAVIVTVGPFYDKTDGVTIKTGLTISNERITLTADTDAGSAPTNILDNIPGATSGTSNDLNYITGNDAGMMQLELAAADVNRLGRMFLSITDAANHVPVFHEFMVLPAMIYDAFVLGTDVLDASVTQILGTAAATPATAGILEVNVKNFNNLAAVALPLVPTTAGRTLDVSATGEAGVDWANVGGQSTTVGLSGTTIKTATDIATATTAIQADTDDIQTRLPAALTSGGNIKAGVQGFLDTVFTEGAAGRIAAAFKQFFNIATPAATMDHGVLVDTVTTSTNLTNAPTSGDLTATMKTSVTTAATAATPIAASVAGAVGSIATGGIAAGSFAANAITAAAIAADAIGASELAADAVTEIQNGLATSTALATAQTAITAIKAATDNLPSDPADESLIIAATDAIMTRLGVAGAGLTAVPWNPAWDAEVQSEVQDALDGTLADAIPADGTRPSISSALYMLTQFLLERSVSSTTVTVKKPDGSTTLFTLTLDDATTPTSITRAT